jgi:PIN domain nuclease of toxin-antitoxin system
VKVLLDTNALLWWRSGSSRLPTRVSDEISDPDNNIVVSIASLWEIAIKRGLGKLRFPENFDEVMAEEEFDLLTITYAHLRMLGGLPQHHRDPFDRMMVAQALAEGIPIATSDRVFTSYGVQIVW